jgi:ribosomal-protein-alanine N-acetyltransferase
MYYFIEPMAEDDIGAVQAIERRSFTTLWSASTYRRELLHSASSRYIVLRASPTQPPPRAARQPLGGRSFLRRSLLGQLVPRLFPPPAPSPFPLVGYGGLWITESEAHITTIAVVPEQRGRGLGELLLNGLIDNAAEGRASWVSLEVRVSNVVAQKLYLKYGFRPAGTRARYYTDNGEDALMMWTEPINSAEYQERLAALRAALFARLRAQADGTQIPADAGNADERRSEQSAAIRVDSCGNQRPI